MIDDSSLLTNEPAQGEHGKVRYSADGVPRRELLVAIGVDLEDDSLTGQILCGARNLRSCGAAWSAPVCPEVDEDRNPGALDNLIEEFSIDL